MEKWISEHIGSILVSVLVFALFFISVLSAVFIAKWGFHFGDGRSDWGVAGDFFGGVLNPIFGFLSLMALLATIVLQSIELKETKREAVLSRVAQEKSETALADQAQTLQKQLDESRKSANTVGFLHAVDRIQVGEVRDARDLLFSLHEAKVNFGQWSTEQVKSAEVVCQSYDVLGMMLKNDMAPREIILQNWNRSILKSWDAASDLVIFR